MVANNIIALVNLLDELQPLPRKYPDFQQITLGPENGIVIMNKVAKMSNMANQIKLSYLKDIMEALRGDEVRDTSSTVKTKTVDGTCQVTGLLGIFGIPLF